jgi:N-acetylglucosaminyldiphosphoundecaprenol N-acetyl-beta-D-mannosaminyltransferase
MDGRLERCRVLGVQVARLTVNSLHDCVASYIRRGHKALVLHANVHCLNLSCEQRWLRDWLNAADIVFCDGAGVILGARLLGCHIPQRITYADWMWQLADFCEAHQFTLYFLGARPGVAERAAERLCERFPDLRVNGTHHGHFDKTPGNPENQAVIRKINAVQPDILLVGLGMPLQERWLLENWDQVEAKVALTGGAVFDYISGELRRAPSWMTDHGLEWLGRLIIEPRRLWQRYVIGNPVFLWRVFKQRLGLLRFE